MRNAGLEEIEIGVKIARKSINNLIYADDVTLLTGSKEDLRNLLLKVKGKMQKQVYISIFRKKTTLRLCQQVMQFQ